MSSPPPTQQPRLTSSTPSPLSTLKAPNLTYVSVSDLYDRWASTYDTDSNALQALDSLQLRSLLPAFLDLVHKENPVPKSMTPNDAHENTSDTIHPSIKVAREALGGGAAAQNPLHIVDLGCGTGRATLALISHLLASPFSTPRTYTITGLDLSPSMLSLAETRCTHLLSTLNPSPSSTPSATSNPPPSSPPTITLTFSPFDLHSPSLPSTLSFPPASADCMLSTLTLEHLPLKVFFCSASLLLRPGGLLLLTNMHPSMGSISRAGFTDPETGKKWQTGGSWVHGVQETVDVAKRLGWEVMDLDIRDKGKGDRDRVEGGEGKENGGGKGEDEGKRVGRRGGKGLWEAKVTDEMVEMDVGGLGKRGGKWRGVDCWFGILFRKEGKGEGK